MRRGVDQCGAQILPVQIEGEGAVAQSGSGHAALRRCSPELVEVLLGLSYPAWVETSKGEVLVYNQVRFQGALLGAMEMCSAKAEAETIGASIGEAGRANNRWSVVAFPVFCAIGGELRVIVLCGPGEQRARDQELALLLWGRLLKGAGADEQSRLTVQQRQVYRLLRQGLSYKEMAVALGVAHSTVRVQVAAIRKALGENKVPVLRRGRDKPI